MLILVVRLPNSSQNIGQEDTKLVERVNRDRAGKAGRILENKRNARFGHALSRHSERFKICNLRPGDANCNLLAHEE